MIAVFSQKLQSIAHRMRWAASERHINEQDAWNCYEEWRVMIREQKLYDYNYMNCAHISEPQTNDSIKAYSKQYYIHFVCNCKHVTLIAE